ncbi:endopeptidase La [Clostridium thermarum]|uniref:endopeptidase La n=1 Tax=Clostridium thermarum TaxID=1716543 RepID=UPI001120EBA6|nr:endopeptidase La [Clostridium thermarum]
MIGILDFDIKRLVIPVSDGVLLPGMVETLRLNSLNEVELEHLQEESPVCIALQLKQNFNSKNLTEADFNDVGVLFEVNQMQREDGIYKINITVLDRIEIKKLEISTEAVFGEYEIASDIMDMTEEEKENVLDQMKNAIREISSYFKGAQPFMQVIDDIYDLNKLVGMVSQYMRLTREEKYELLYIQSIKDRALKFADYLVKHREHVKLQVELAEKFNEKSNKNYREQVLREHMKIIQKELNEGSGTGNKKDYRQRIEEAQMPEEIKAIALEELAKLESQSPSSSDYNIIRNYLDLLVALPWKTPEVKEIDIAEARRILNEQHYGLDKVKERILQHLAVMKLKKDKKGSILLLVGPPGVGKTSLGKSIADALARKYIRLSLGGIRDEAEIRGHRRTYVGAMPGRIIQTIKKAGAKNPVLILDEVDKLMSGHNGDPASALLEVLDPEQNSTFTDHYLDAPYDLSEVFFVATANSLDTIPRPLLDRMEVIQISSYTGTEKFHIGKNHLIPEIIDEHGLTSDQLIIEDEALQKIIDDYTVEAGVRGLKKQLAAVTRVAAEKIVSNTVEVPYVITAATLEDILGKKVSRYNKVKEVNPPGVVTGLAWTPVGGEILFIEVTDMPGNGQIILTGKLGEVMKESARISLSLLKSRLAANSFNFKEKDLHIHVPAGATPKDGPSAGIALTTALASLITGISVDSKLAMTGEITLRGSVLPIGGLKEKLFGAVRAGVKKVLIPADNVADLKDVPKEIVDELTIIPVETIEEVLREALGINMRDRGTLFLSRDFV